jgi:Mitochondrial ATP synthase B chain precursor (ATP-synt_B)
LTWGSQTFHATTKREDEAAPVLAAAKPPAVESSSGWDPIYAVPLGIAFAVPAINYEWYIVNEETQLAACFIAFVALVYKNFGGVIHDVLAEDGKRILLEHNKVEDEILGILKAKRDDLLFQANVVQDAQDIQALKVATYEKLNAAGQIKPQHDFKAQIEKLLTMIKFEEATRVEKQKVDLMTEATQAVTTKLLSTKTLQKACLDNAIAQLKGGAAGTDPVKQTFIDFFKYKQEEAKKIDEKVEMAEARAGLITKLNATASNEGFFFRFDAAGKPMMNA